MKRRGRTLSILAAIGLTLAAGRGSSAEDRRIVLTSENVGVEGVEGPEVTRKKARKVLNEARKAFSGIAGHFALSSKDIFFIGRARPLWMSKAVSKDPRILVLLEDEVDVGDTGPDAYLRRMQRGKFLIHLSAPGEDLAPTDRYRLWREMAHAVLCHLTWRSCPYWLRTGIAEAMAARGADGECPERTEVRKELEKEVGDAELRKILAATSVKGWGARERAVCWAVVRMLEESRGEFVPGLLNHVHSLFGDLAGFPSDSALVGEYTVMVLDQMDESIGETGLSAPLAAWVKAGFPTGSAHRRTDAYKTLKKIKIPEACGVSMAGHFGSRQHVEDETGIMRTYQPFSRGHVAWRLPWPSKMEVRIGVRAKGKAGRSYSYGTTMVGPNGRRKLSDLTLDLPMQRPKFGFMKVRVASPNGLVYEFHKDFPVK